MGLSFSKGGGALFFFPYMYDLLSFLGCENPRLVSRRGKKGKHSPLFYGLSVADFMFWQDAGKIMLYPLSLLTKEVIWARCGDEKNFPRMCSEENLMEKVLGAYNTQIKATEDWQGRDYCPILIPHIDNTPDILHKMNNLCPVDVPSQSNADSDGTRGRSTCPSGQSTIIQTLLRSGHIYEVTNTKSPTTFISQVHMASEDRINTQNAI